MAELKLDKSCIPYPRKVSYRVINLPYLGLLILTICPKSALRLYCPSAKLSNLIYKKINYANYLAKISAFK